jgi:Arc/MetJ family transcription regulator
MEGFMRTNIDLDDKLVDMAMEISGVHTKKAVVNLALEEYIRHYNRKRILKYRGKKIWEGDLDKMRSTR